MAKAKSDSSQPTFINPDGTTVDVNAQLEREMQEKERQRLKEQGEQLKKELEENYADRNFYHRR